MVTAIIHLRYKMIFCFHLYWLLCCLYPSRLGKCDLFCEETYYYLGQLLLNYMNWKGGRNRGAVEKHYKILALKADFKQERWVCSLFSNLFCWDRGCKEMFFLSFWPRNPFADSLMKRNKSWRILTCLPLLVCVLEIANNPQLLLGNLRFNRHSY